MRNSTAPVVDELVVAVGAGQVIVDEISDKYLKDWSGAEAEDVIAVLRPRTTEELAAMLRICHAHGARRWCRRGGSPASSAARCRGGPTWRFRSSGWIASRRSTSTPAR
jgi:FAD/FMN-containing dehydrogenase